VCKTYVVGTATGHCARCGFVPPTARDVPPIARAVRTDLVLLVLAIVAALVALFAP
jgi:hypothetical protein